MPRTQIDSQMIKNSGINRNNLNTTEKGKAVITNLATGSNKIIMVSTGADQGTGSVTIDLDPTNIYLSASNLNVNTSQFNNNLAITDNTVQKALDKIDNMTLPTIYRTIVTSEALTLGDFVDIYFDPTASAGRIRRSSATNQFPAKGFVLNNYVQGSAATVYFVGSVNNKVTAQAGKTYYLHASVPGGIQDAPVTGSNLLSQTIGVGCGVNEVLFHPSEPVVLA